MKVGEQFAEANLTEGSRNSTRKDAKILGSQILFNDSSAVLDTCRPFQP